LVLPLSLVFANLVSKNKKVFCILRGEYIVHLE
jgi:hypothetical protein